MAMTFPFDVPKAFIVIDFVWFFVLPFLIFFMLILCVAAVGAVGLLFRHG